MGPKSLLTEAEEAVLIAYIKGSARRAQPVTRQNVLDAVTSILENEEEEGTHRRRPSSFDAAPKRKWWRLFRNRHPEIAIRTPETLTTSQTDFHMTTHRGAQTSGRMFETACISYLIQCGYSILPPESTTSQMEKLKGPKKSWDDLVLNQHPAREFIASRSIPSPNPSVLRSSSRGSSRTSTPLPFLSSPPSTSYATPEPQVTPVLQRAPTKTTPSTLSSAFRTFNFYPERRQGQGPKRPRNEMDRTFAITSDKAIRALKMQMEEREAKIQKKGIRGRRTGRIKKVPPKPASSSDSENSNVPLPLPVVSSDDDIDLEQDPHSLCIKVSLNLLLYF